MLLTFLFFLCALALTTGIYFVLPENTSLLWLLPIAIGFFVAINLLYLLYLITSTLFFKKEAPKKYSHYAYTMVALTADWFLTLLRVRVRVEGRDKLPASPAVFVSNHRSAMDPLVSLRAFKRGRRLCFISKASVLKWPIVGPYMLKGGSLFIERDSPLQSLRTIRAAATNVREQGLSYGIFPEGTRTKNGKVGEFKEGAFIAAKRAECPIVVVTTEGTERAFRGLSPKIKVTVRAVIDAETVKNSTHTELAALSREVITKALGE